MMKAIRAVKLAASDKGRHATWETVVTPQNFMPRTLDQMTHLDNLRERKELARGNHTIDNLEKEKKGEVISIPPTTMEESQKGLCTYSHFLSMVGFVNKAHYKWGDGGGHHQGRDLHEHHVDSDRRPMQTVQ
jgi:hypothetical protein